MAIRTDIGQLQAALEQWESLLRSLDEALERCARCEHEAAITGLPDIVGVLSRFHSSVNDLQALYQRTQEVCLYLRRAIELMQTSGQAPEDVPALARCPICSRLSPPGERYCRFCGNMLSTTDAQPELLDHMLASPTLIPAGTTLRTHRLTEVLPDDAPDDEPSDWGSGEFDAAPPPEPQAKPAETRDTAGRRIIASVDDGYSHVREAKHFIRHSAPRPSVQPEWFDTFDDDLDFTGDRPICSTCGASAPAGQRFCINCGCYLKDAAPAPKPAPKLSQVQFSAVAPRRFERGAHSMVDIFMYEDGWRQVVDRHIRAMEKEAQETGSGYRRVAEGAQIRIVLTSPDIDIPDSEQSALWGGRYLQFTFAVRVPKDFRRKEFLLQAAVFVDDVPLTRLTWTMRRDSIAHGLSRLTKPRRGAQTPETVRSDITSAFISYSSADLERVTPIIQGIRAVRPDLDIFFDVDSLHSGEQWRRTLEKEIARRDVLFLCWSASAKESEWVNYEWKYALEHKGLDAIQPVPLELPSVCPPPPELNDLHFNDKLLYFRKIINANT